MKVQVTEWAMAEDGSKVEPSLAHLRIAKTGTDRRKCSRQGRGSEDQGGNSSGQVLGHVVGSWKAQAVSTEGTAP